MFSSIAASTSNNEGVEVEERVVLVVVEEVLVGGSVKYKIKVKAQS